MGNIDYAEIDKFDRISDRWWDRNGEMKSLHDINPLRVGYIEKRKRLKGARVLDVGVNKACPTSDAPEYAGR